MFTHGHTRFLTVWEVPKLERAAGGPGRKQHAPPWSRLRTPENENPKSRPGPSTPHEDVICPGGKIKSTLMNNLFT